jgi:electron transfer flavoprotein alpha/beta subunit
VILDVDLTGVEPAVSLRDAKALDSLKVVVYGGRAAGPRLENALTGASTRRATGQE